MIRLLKDPDAVFLLMISLAEAAFFFGALRTHLL